MDAGDGFREFVSAHQGELSRVAYLLVGELAAAEDLLQVALAKTAARVVADRTVRQARGVRSQGALPRRGVGVAASPRGAAR